MTRIGHISQLARMHWGIEKLKRQANALLDRPAELVLLVFHYTGGSLKPLQVEQELAGFVTEVKKLKPRTVLEIGTARGGTLFLWTRLAQPDATIVSIDLPGGKFGGGYSEDREAVYRRFAGRNQKLYLLRQDSHAQATLDQAKELFSGQPVDLLFIDGDHTYEGVKRDWEMYSQLVRPGGMVAFHDIVEHPPTEGCEVDRLWSEIKAKHESGEFIADPAQKWAGIGYVRWNQVRPAAVAQS